MFLSLRFYRLILTFFTYLLPWAAFEIGYQLWLSLWGYVARSASYPRAGHNGLLLLCSFVWAFMAERYRVTSVEEMFRERTGAKAALKALVATSAVYLAIVFFSRDAIFPRGLFLCGIVALFVLTMLLRVVGYFEFSSLAINRRSRCGSKRGRPVLSLHFSPGAAPQVGQRTVRACLGLSSLGSTSFFMFYAALSALRCS